MDILFVFLFSISFICLIIGLIKPRAFSRFIKGEITRKKIGLIFGIAAFVFFLLIGITASKEGLPRSQKITEKTSNDIFLESTGIASTTTEAEINSTSASQQLKTADCKISNYLPDKKCDPGEIDPRVTQDNLSTTICKSGYTTTVRPSSSVTDKMKIIDMAAYGFTDSKSNYEYDHIIPLELGGSPADTRNLFPESYAEPYGATDKDKVENKLNALVCAGSMTLTEAQKEISTNWVNIYIQYYGTDTAIKTSATVPTTSELPVKKSTTGICHVPGTTYYNRTTNFTPYNTLQECLDSGGRLPAK